jgi:hypothetical protein
LGTCGRGDAASEVWCLFDTGVTTVSASCADSSQTIGKVHRKMKQQVGLMFTSSQRRRKQCRSRIDEEMNTSVCSLVCAGSPFPNGRRFWGKGTAGGFTPDSHISAHLAEEHESMLSRQPCQIPHHADSSFLASAAYSVPRSPQLQPCGWS